MAYYKSFTHVERLGKEETDGILEGTCYISPKLDGTNAVIWHSPEKGASAGSRNRELSPLKDNAGFYAWVQSDDPEATALRRMLQENPHFIVYGEFGVGRVAHIKDYDCKAHDKLWIFDIYDINTQNYIHPEMVEAICLACGLSEWHIPYIKIENPTQEQILNIAEENQFLLSNANHAGEGVVIRNHNFRNKHGRYVIAKFVLDEFKQRMIPKPKKDVARDGCEQDIVDYYVTDAELSKAKAKVCLAFGAENFELNGKFIGMYLNIVFNDAVLAEMTDICKRYRRPIIDFQVLNNLCSIKAREYLGL